MAPVDPPSLGPVLDLIERWQRWNDVPDGTFEVCDTLMRVDIPALRTLAEQHAAQLRLIECCSDTSINPVAAAAANFLGAPRREQEGE